METELREKVPPQPKEPERWLFKGGVVLTGDEATGDFVRGDVLVEGGKILAVSTELDCEAARIDASEGIVLPGLVDAHKHPWVGPFKYGMPDNVGGNSSHFMNRLLHALRPEDVYISALAEDLAAINAGTTTVLDYAFISKAPEVVDACIEGHRASGMRVVYCYGETRDDVQRRHNPTATARTPSVPAFPQDLARIQSSHFSASDHLLTLRLADTWGEYFAIARQHGIGITCDGVYGVATALRSVDWTPHLRALAARGELAPDITLIHCTGLSDEMFGVIAAHGVAVTLAPFTDATYRGAGDSVAPIQKVLDHGLLDRTGLSTDAAHLEPGHLFDQMRAVLVIQRMLASQRWQAGDPNAPAPMKARDLLTMATRGGARAVGLGDRVGSLTPGKDADIIMIRYGDLGLGPLTNAVGSVVLGSSPSNVDTVMIRGVIRKRAGRLVDVDESSVMRRLQASREYLAAAAGVWREDDIVRNTLS
jgi:cytosine/adenosine deaminase-related metal-dependent hydrolase